MSDKLPEKVRYIMPNGINITIPFRLTKTIYKNYHKIAEKVIYIY